MRSPPWTLPTPPWRRRRTLCPSISASFFFLFQLLQSRQCLFKVRSVLHWHSIGTCLVWSQPPITLVMLFLWNQMVCMIFIFKSIPLSTSIFVSTIFNHSIAECFISYESVMDTLEASLLALLFSAGWWCSIPCLPVSYRIGVREVVLSLWRSQEWKGGPSCTWWICDFPIFLYARSARTCSRQCQCPSMINILCTAFWVPSRAIHTVQCFQLHESFFLILDWRD